MLARKPRRDGANQARAPTFSSSIVFHDQRSKRDGRRRGVSKDRRRRAELKCLMWRRQRPQRLWSELPRKIVNPRHRHSPADAGGIGFFKRGVPKPFDQGRCVADQPANRLEPGGPVQANRRRILLNRFKQVFAIAALAALAQQLRR